jgi:hypothetical protein
MHLVIVRETWTGAARTVVLCTGAGHRLLGASLPIRAVRIDCADEIIISSNGITLRKWHRTVIKAVEQLLRDANSSLWSLVI